MEAKTYKILFALAATLIVAGAILFENFRDLAPYIFAVGVVIILFLRSKTMYKGENPRLRRLYRILFFGTLLYVVSAVLMYMQNMLWAMTLAISAVIELVVALRMPKQQEE